MSAASQRLRGFTAIELVITMAIAAVFAGVAFPSFVATVRTARLNTTGDLLNADLLIARREAIKQNGKVLMCPVGASVGACGTDFTKWANGWMVCYDLNGDGACDTTASGDPNPIVQRGKLDPSLTLTGPASVVTFNANGTVSANATFTVRGNWTGSTAYVDTITASGNISLAKGS